MQQLRKLLLDGLLLAVPLIVVGALLSKALQYIAMVTTPIAARFPNHVVWGVGMSETLLAVGLLISLLILGWISQSRSGRAASAYTEKLVLHKIPGYLYFKAMAANFIGVEDQKDNFTPVLVEFDDSTSVGFVIEAPGSPDGLATVFVPSAPTPAAGVVLLVQARRLRKLTCSVTVAMRTITSLGLGTQALLRDSAATGQAAFFSSPETR